MTPRFSHPAPSRRGALQAGAVGLLGLGAAELQLLRAAGSSAHPARAVIYVFLSGGLAQHESFDPKPDAPDAIRGEFGTTATRTPGVRITEHLPLLAARSSKWALVRSLTHRSNDHSLGHHIMLTGRSDAPPGFNPSAPTPTDHPALAAVAGAVLPPRNNLPPAVVLPDKIVHNTGRTLPGQFAGRMGRPRDPWFLEASAFEPKAYGAYPTHEFDHQQRPFTAKRQRFTIPDLSLPDGIDPARFGGRRSLLAEIDRQRTTLDIAAAGFDKRRQDAVSLLTDARVRKAFDLDHADPRDLDRYGRNAFGWSLLTAARLVEAGVSLVQVNLGNNETWDTHGNAFPHLKDKLLPPTDRAVAALLDDLDGRGLLDSTLVVMAGEFGRTPRVSTLTQHYKGPGRDHWGAVQSVFLAGGGVRGGRVVGASDKNGGYPIDAPQSPENFAATIYDALGIPKAAHWPDAEGRPHFVYHADPMPV
ncbi:DUF1501 domain-containing protein [Urbifossiella limnaea]|uniref:DUF1501 domain-containing protein n=1 Tax=Urbifossiella limnaea TaxID=2528023 RepID=A0A517XNF3_9BACT|nr:DUF1501 domain-containing protein [Urbifossiella limnaea]QDU19038.1 hypothetical protein ETAA1_09410 [Urbifossiella limnaea]